ncbi:MAG TPA: hypothetical protein PKD28_01365 [Candidatus Saccharibacteria bacterium]|nr:hypothetical protein [Candidatus Saccharibacteria bacterium]
MATHNHPPTPGTNKRYVIGDETPSWPIWYAFIYGTLAGVIGWVASPWPFVFIGLMALGLFILWFLRQYGRAPLLATILTQDALKVAVYAIIVGIIGWIAGALTGTLLIDLMAGLTSILGPLGIIVPIAAILTLAVAAIGLLLAAGYRVRWATITCLVVLAVVVMFMTQQAHGISQTPFEKNKTACVQDATNPNPDFVVGC